MKCENCGKNEVSFVYRSNINGKVEEKHLCQECAEKLGYAQKIFANRRSLMDEFMGDGFFGRSLMEDFFRPMPSLFGQMERFLEDPFEDFFAPALGSGEAKAADGAPQTATDPGVRDVPGQSGAEEQSRFSRMRRLNALRMEMKQAVRQQNFERAAEIRDEIRRLEDERREGKESA